MHQVETSILPTYYISPMKCNETKLQSGMIVNPTISPVIIENEEENLSGEEKLIQVSLEK